MMPSGVFEAYEAQMEPLHAERILDAAQAASAHMAGSEWWDSLVARARGVAHQVRRVLFTFNGQKVFTSGGLRQKFSDSVTGGRVES